MKVQHASKTRKIQRTVTKHLKSLGLSATSKAVKTLEGWITSVDPVSIKKPVKMVCSGINGRSVNVLIK